jgi:hypothetical protein
MVMKVQGEVTLVHTMKVYRESEGLAPLILNVGSTLQLLYPRKKEFLVPME